MDQLAVLAYSVKEVGRRSKYRCESVVLAYNARITEQDAAKLKRLGFDRVILAGLPVELSEVKDRGTKEELDKHTADLHLITELVKLRGYELVEYSRVFMIDADTLVLDHMDELSGPDSDNVSLYATFDYGMMSPPQRWPPVQGGFLAMRPDKAVYDELTQLVREETFCCGLGWAKSKIGWAYGGVGPQGLLAYYYLRDHLDWITTDLSTAPWRPGRKFVEVDQCQYDVLGIENCVKTRLNAKQWVGSRNRTLIRKICVNDECRHSESEAQMEKEFKHMHFTSLAHFRPWGDCDKTGDGGPYGAYNTWICRFMNKEWWRIRTRMEKELGLKQSRGYCNNRNPYEQIAWPQ